MVSGELFDNNINFFQIDPKKDYVVLSIAEGSTGVREVVRTWWSMVYWGWDLDRLAFLNGSVEYNYQNCKDYLVATSSPNPKITKEYHMSDIKTDRTSLHLYMNEVKDIVANNNSGYFLADARGTGEYSGEKKSKTASKECGSNHDEQCYSAFKGHIKGAVDFPYTDMLVMDDEKCDLNGDGKIDKNDASYKFKSYDELKDIYASKGYNSCDTVIGYCRTGRKSTILALTSTVVLGYPFRMYDGSWIQWGSMASVKDTNGDYILPEDSNIRADVEKYSEILGYNDSLYVEPKGIYEIDLNATDTQNIKNEDQSYLAQ
jgi:3-mercaptopyruvate sulfurtransferase SseA